MQRGKDYFIVKISSMSKKDAYRQFMELDFSTLCEEHAVSQLGIFCDLSWDLRKTEGLNKIIAIANELAMKPLTNTQKVDLYFYAANAWACLKQLLRAGSDLSWDWEQVEIENEIVLLRKACLLIPECLDDPLLTPERICTVYTNLANLLDNIGRYIEAIEYWNKAIDTIPEFGMAIANKGYGLSTYARQLYDKEHVVVLLQFSHQLLTKSVESDDPNIYPQAKDSFRNIIVNIESVLGKENVQLRQNLDEFSLGDTEAEVAYRQWCLENTLFINPLNDLGNYPIASTDVLHVPDLITSREVGPDMQAFFNQLKQEYAYGRFTYYEGIITDASHYADRDVLLFMLPQNITYSIAIEKVKSAFRIAYSILDKIAYIINYYFNLNVDENKIYFRTIWYKENQKKKGLRDEFLSRSNLSLRGLFWLSKDLFEDKDDFRLSIEPEAKEINALRNYIEHKYLKVQSDSEYDLFYEQTYGFKLTDKHFQFITRKELEAKTLKLLKLTRAAIIYLSLAIETEERDKRNNSDDTLTLPIKLGIFKDKWKT